MDLFQRFALGEIDAFETLVRHFQSEIYAWIVRIVGDPGIAEDLTVETLWRIYRACHRFRPDGNFSAWARRIATNLALDYLRRKRPEQSLVADLVGAPQRDHLLQREMQEKIHQAFRRLPAKLQVVAMLALVEEQPYDEIADALGTSVGAVKLRVFRAVRILRRQLSHLGGQAVKKHRRGLRKMTKHDNRQIRETLQQAFPPVNTEIHRDLWPAVLRKLEARPAQMPWYDWALIGLSSAVFLFFPQLIFVFAYHL